MKRLLITGCLCFSILTSFAQKNLLIPVNEIVIGKNYKTDKDIKAKEYVFPKMIVNYQIDTLKNLLTIQLFETNQLRAFFSIPGNVIIFDLLNKTIKLNKKNAYYNNVFINNNSIIFTSPMNSCCLNMENGDEQWRANNSIIGADYALNVGYGYEYNYFKDRNNTLGGIDLTTGNTIWKRKINREYGWNGHFYLNDSTIIIAASGLHTINLHNGDGWDFNAITGEHNYKSDLTQNMHYLVVNVASNVLVDSANIYFASKENITRLDHKGQIIWSYPLPKALTSKSSIFMKDSLIYIVNEGFATIENKKVDYGIPYFGACHLTTGKQVFMSAINNIKDRINDFSVHRDTIFFVSKKRVTKMSMINGLLISEKVFDTKALGELDGFVSPRVFVKSDSTFKRLVSSDSTKQYLITGTKTLTTNKNFEVLNQTENSQLYILYLKTKFFKLLAQGDETIVINHENKIIADLKIPINAVLIGSKLYKRKENSLLEIDMSELMKD